MKSWLFLIAAVLLLMVICEYKQPSPQSTIAASEPVATMYKVLDTRQMFADYVKHKNDGMWDRVYLNTILRVKAYYVDSDDDRAVFVTQPDDCYKRPYINIEKLEEAKEIGPGSPFGSAIYCTKLKDVKTHFSQGQYVTIDIVIEKMLDDSRMICRCIRADAELP